MGLMNPLSGLSYGIARVALSMAAVISTGCGGGDEGGGTDAPRRFDGAIVVGGLARSYTLNLPPSYHTSRAAVPLVIAMHGGGGSAAQFEATNRLTPKAEAAGVAVVYPNGTSGGLGLNTWNGGGCCGHAVSAQINDVAFIRALIDQLVATYRIDAKRVYATGHSNGGIMSYRLACELSDRIAAIAPNAAALMLDACTPARAVPVLHMHSKLDQNVPIAGGVGVGLAGVDFPPLQTSIDRWVALNSCLSSADVRSGVNYTQSIWSLCRNGASVQLLLTDDGGHAWPGGLPGAVGNDMPSTAIDANDRLLSFFAAHALP